MGLPWYYRRHVEAVAYEEFGPQPFRPSHGRVRDCIRDHAGDRRGFIGFSLMILMFYKILRYKTNDKNRDDMIKIITIASLIFMLPGNFFDFFELSMFVTMISAMVCNNNFNINIKDINYKDILIYTLICFIFLVIGVTK